MATIPPSTILLPTPVFELVRDNPGAVGYVSASIPGLLTGCLLRTANGSHLTTLRRPRYETR